MAAGAAPEVPVLAYLAIGVLAFVSWIVLRGAASAYRMTFGYLIERLAGLLRIDVAFVHWHPGNALLAVSDDFYGILTQGAAKSEHAVGYFFHGAAVIQEWATRELLHFATDTFAWAEKLERTKLPKWARWAVKAAIPPLLIANLVTWALRKELPHLLKLVHGETRVIEQTVVQKIYPTVVKRVTRVEKIAGVAAGLAVGTIAGGLTLPWAHVHIFPRLGHLEREANGIRKRLHRLEALLGVTAFAGLMAKVLGLPNWRCLTRGNIGRTARALCGIPTHLLNDLLGLIADFVILTDICEVVGWLSEGLKVVQPELVALVTTADMALCHGDYNPPPAFTVAPFTVPGLEPRSAPAEV